MREKLICIISLRRVLSLPPPSYQWPSGGEGEREVCRHINCLQGHDRMREGGGKAHFWKQKNAAVNFLGQEESSE